LGFFVATVWSFRSVDCQVAVGNLRIAIQGRCSRVGVQSNLSCILAAPIPQGERRDTQFDAPSEAEPGGKSRR